jgi:serine/threonine-protein kinase
MTGDDRLAAAFQGRYRLDREIGTGGMATVWLAQDLRHDRKVAIKVMHPELTAAIGADRFLAEIRVTANLQHPHILPLHDSGHVAGTGSEASVLYYVMPFVQGESLRDRLQRERLLPLSDAIAIARDVLSALDYAHRQGVIHRDIKPENILLHEGRPLVADFGIALAVSAAGTARMTQTGLSLGTPQYMSPEQAMGERSIDKRTDIYALGAVLYEMLTGEPPFTGATVQAIVAKVMAERPVPPSTVRDTVPPHVEDAVLTALAKLPADRFGSASEFSHALGLPSEASTLASASRRATAPVPAWRRWAAPVIAAAAVVLAAVAWAGRTRATPNDSAPVMRFEIPIPDSLRLQKVVLTPDGTRLLLSTDAGPFVYTFADARLARLDIPGVKAATDVDVTPDGETLVFRDGNAVKTMAFRGGPVRTMVDSLLTVRVGDDGYVYGRRWSRVRRISLATGHAETVRFSDSLNAAIDSLFGEIGEPLPVPGGRGVVFTITTYAPARTLIAALDVKSARATFAPNADIPSARLIGFSPAGQLLVRGLDAIYAIPLDPRRLEFTDAPEQVVDNVPTPSMWCVGTTCSSSSINGQSLVYVVSPLPTPALVNSRGEWRSLSGIRGNLIFAGAVASPDGRMLLAQVEDKSGLRQDIWTYRMPGGPLERLTSGTDGFFWAPRWIGNETVRFASVSKTEEAIHSMPADGSRPWKVILKRRGGFSYSISHHPDGRRIATNTCVAKTDPTRSNYAGEPECKEFALGILFTDLPDSVVVLGDAVSQARNAEFSPDGRFVAFRAREVDRHELFVMPLDGRPDRWRVSQLGAERPRWSHDSRRLFFMANDSLYVTEWRPDSPSPVGSTRALFRLGLLNGVYDPLPGDSTFIMIAPNQAEKTRIVVIANFVEQLRRSSR